MATIPDRIEDPSPSIGRIFSRAFAVMRHNPLVVFGTSLVIGAIPSVVVGIVFTATIAPEMGTGRYGSIVGGSIVLGLAYLLLSVVNQACQIRATAADSEGRRAGLGECLGAALGRVVPLVGATILYALAVSLGMFLLIVPGLILLVRYTSVIPVLMEERSGLIDAFRRSAALTKGARWKIFGLFLLLGVLSWLLAAVAGLGTLAAAGRTTAVQLGLGVSLWRIVINTLSMAFWGTIQAALYVELRDWKDGPATTRLNEIFE